jgi:hypothetical protein
MRGPCRTIELILDAGGARRQVHPKHSHLQGQCAVAGAWIGRRGTAGGELRTIFMRLKGSVTSLLGVILGTRKLGLMCTSSMAFLSDAWARHPA